MARETSPRNPFEDLARAASARRDILIEVAAIRTDGGTQPRAGLNGELVAEYAGRMQWSDDGTEIVDPQGDRWENLVVYDDADTYWLADGFHRLHAAQRAGIDRFQAKIMSGGRRDAVLASLSANALHGARRTNEDKRRAVKRALTDKVWGEYTDNRISELCKVSQPFVSKMRKELIAAGEIEHVEERIALDDRVVEVKQHTRRLVGTTSAPRRGVITVIPPEPTIEAEEPDDLGSTLTLPAELPRLTFKGLKDVDDDAHGVLLAAPNGWRDLRTLRDQGLRVARHVVYPLGQGRQLIEGASIWYSDMTEGRLHAVHHILPEGVMLIVSRSEVPAIEGSTLEELAAELGDGDAARVGGGV